MTIFFQYLLRLSICFAVMYLFYAVVLRRLTFYNHNRWYLLGYSVLCFVIPLVNFSPKDTGVIYSSFVEMIPVVMVSKKAVIQPHQWFDINNLILWIFLTGIFVMLAKLLIQLFSYKKLVSNATIISNDNTIKLYQIDKEIVPFSSNEEFKKQNPDVDNWLTSYGIKDSANAPDRLLYTVYLKNGETEKYDFSDPREFKKFLKKYKSIPPETVYKFTPIGHEPKSN